MLGTQCFQIQTPSTNKAWVHKCITLINISTIIFIISHCVYLYECSWQYSKETNNFRVGSMLCTNGLLCHLTRIGSLQFTPDPWGLTTPPQWYLNAFSVYLVYETVEYYVLCVCQWGYWTLFAKKIISKDRCVGWPNLTQINPTHVCVRWDWTRQGQVLY